MHTARFSDSGGVSLQRPSGPRPPPTETPLDRDCPTPGRNMGQAPRQEVTGTCETITLLKTLFAGGKNLLWIPN